MHSPIFAFDFSMNKPAMCSLVDNNLRFYFWPTDIDKESAGKYANAYVNITCRNLPPMKDSEYDESSLIVEHVTRAKELASTIANIITSELEFYECKPEDAIIANEGFAFAARGDAALDLSGYKYILMERLIREGFKNFKTYSPITIKATAGCAKRGLGKDAMIEAFREKGPTLLHPFIASMSESPEFFKKKTAYIKGIDDLVDAYWCLKTCIIKENISCLLS